MGVSDAYAAKLDELTRRTQEMGLLHRAYRDAAANGSDPATVAAAKRAYEDAKNAVDEVTADAWEMIESGEAMAGDQP